MGAERTGKSQVRICKKALKRNGLVSGCMRVAIGPVIGREIKTNSRKRAPAQMDGQMDIGLVKHDVCPKVGLRSRVSGQVFLGWLSVL